MKNSDKVFTIDEVCALVEMNRRRVRYYIQKGLVDRPEGVGKAAYYTHRHLEQLLAVRKWKIAGLSLERIREIVMSDKNAVSDGKPTPPPIDRKKGMVEVWSHMHVDDGIEIHIEPGRAGLSPDQVRRLFRYIMAAYQRIRKEELDNVQNADSTGS